MHVTLGTVSISRVHVYKGCEDGAALNFTLCRTFFEVSSRGLNFLVLKRCEWLLKLNCFFL